MTEKLYEYKDDKNWFIGKWATFTSLTSFGDDDAFQAERELVSSLVHQLQVDGLQLHLARCHSRTHLVNFLLEMVKDRTGRQIKLIQQSGAVLLEEEDKLLAVILPKEGVSTAAFFGGSSSSFARLGEPLLVATRNEGKTREFRKIFEPLGYKIENLNDYPELPEVAETGTTFEENARLKAETISHLTGKMVLADDSGLKVDALGGLPGVWSARFAGPDATDEENNAKLLHELAMVFDLKQRSAQFHCTLVVAAPEKESLVVQAEWPGRIAFQPQGENGFGYDPLFLVGETQTTSAEWTMEEKNAQSHRAQAVKKLVEVFPEWQAQTKSVSSS